VCKLAAMDRAMLNEIGEVKSVIGTDFQLWH
jgi:hypothetical protein